MDGISQARNRMEFNVNGVTTEVECPQSLRLSEVLREKIGLRDTKVGCNAGDCGACTILLDGDPVCACLVPAGQATNREIETALSLNKNDGRLSALQQSFLRHGAAQCGICTPGMMMAATALLRQNQKPSREAVKDALGGVLCRCTGYVKIIDAVLDAGATLADQPLPAVGKAVGAKVWRLDGHRKVAFTEVFGADNWPSDALLVRAIRSPHFHASFTFGKIGE